MQPMSDTHAGSDPAVHSSAAADEPSPPARGKPVLTPGTAPDAGGARSSRRRSPAEPQPAGAVTPAIGDTRPAPRIGDTRPAPAVGDSRPAPPKVGDTRPAPRIGDTRPAPAVGDPRPASPKVGDTPLRRHPVLARGERTRRAPQCRHRPRPPLVLTRWPPRLLSCRPGRRLPR